MTRLPRISVARGVISTPDATEKPTRVAVCGGVGWTDVATIEAHLDRLLTSLGSSAVAVLTGMAEGADAIARDWAERHRADGVELFAECLEAGPYPGPMHDYNKKLIALAPDVVLAFKDGFDPTARTNGHEPGTEHLVRLAREAAIEVRIFGAEVKNDEEKEGLECPITPTPTTRQSTAATRRSSGRASS